MGKKISNKFIKSLRKRVKSFQSRRPHRSFSRTRRRDYERSLKLPGYFKFSRYVFDTIWANRKTFILLALFFFFAFSVMVGLASQDTYSTLKNTLDSTSKGVIKGNWGEAGKAGLLFISTINGALSGDLTDVQQLYSGILILLTWLTTVWLLRNILANRKVRLRDGLYNSGSPILPTFLVATLLIVQMLPIAIAILGYSAALSTGLLSGGIEAMLFFIAAGLLVVVSLYFVTGTFFALIIVTLPGMSPSDAIRAAGDLVIGRRLRILARILWMVLGVTVVWALTMIPLIMVDSWFKKLWKVIEWVPTIPVFVVILLSLTVVWVASYIYLLYRKVVDDGADPA